MDPSEVLFMAEIRLVRVHVALRMVLRDKDQEIASLKTLLAYYGGI